ncbi:putative Gp13 [Corynebacterium humireducens NBRC 106098 = DSM 45392]|uniref:Putative Gp13 n=1 Tax=Corynebacterium humireducens NBRC 106098 = DSM 45392 TaxID=1223515 RepID=A0A0B5D8H3_9CORY|nr:hypothetical protein [Corynebacterium humireducens]AJE32523.1 putative Gp13 [Corynebacterium humireducens NBRC 106098 = DSM 45392]
MTLPTVPVTAPPANPLPHGLFDAATITDEALSRHIGGITLTSPNQGGHGHWPTVCPTPDDTPDKTGQRPTPEDFASTIVWAVDECKTVGITDEEAQARAAHLLRLTAPVDVEKFAAEQLLTITPATAVSSVADALEVIEDALGEAGYPGVVHARRGLIAQIDSRLIVRQGGVLYTPGGHRWVFGSGYGALENTLVATGPVMIRRGSVVTGMSFDRVTNTRAALAERVITVGWESPTLAVPVNR